MSVTERTRRQVATEVARLQEAYGAFETIEKTWPVSGSWYERTRRRTEAGSLGGAGVWLIGDDGRVLLVRREGENRWEEPGGTNEPDETLVATAVRETREEAGIGARILAVAQVHRITVTAADEPDRPAIVTCYVIFCGSPMAGTPRPEEGEIAAVRWWAEHPDRLHYEELRSLPIPASES